MTCTFKTKDQTEAFFKCEYQFKKCSSLTLIPSMHSEQKINYLYSVFIFIQLLLPLRVIMKSTFLKIFYYRVCVSVGKSSCHFFLQQQFMYYHNKKYQHAPILHCAYDPYMICNLIIFKQSQNIVSRPEKVVPHHKIIFLSFRLKVIFMQIRYSRQNNSLHSH